MLKKNQNVLDTDKIGRLLMRLTVPLFLGMFVQTIYNVVDTVFIGHYVGTEALAALSLVFPLQMLSMGIGNLAGVGGSSLISRFIGSGDKEGAERALGNGLVVGVVFSILFTAIVLPNINLWVRLIGASDNALPFARDYLNIVMSGTIFSVLSGILMVYVRSEGNARVSMIIMILASVLNIVLDAVFIIGLGMGIKGAALATVISQFAATIYALSYYITGSGYLRLHARNFAPDMKILRSILVIGVVQFAQSIAMTLAASFIIKMAAAYGGDLALSSFGIVQRILYFAMMPGMVIGQGMQPILGFNYGARRYHLALRSIVLASIYATVLSIVLFIVLYFFPGPIIRAFTSDEQLIQECIHVTKNVFMALPLVGLFNVGQLVFPSIGKAVQTFIVALMRPVAFLMPLMILLPRIFELDGVWYSFPAADVLSFLLVLIMFIPLIMQFKKSAPDVVGQQVA